MSKSFDFSPCMVKLAIEAFLAANTFGVVVVEVVEVVVEVFLQMHVLEYETGWPTTGLSGRSFDSMALLHVVSPSCSQKLHTSTPLSGLFSGHTFQTPPPPPQGLPGPGMGGTAGRR